MAQHTPGPWEREQVQDGEYTGPGDNPPGYAGDYYETNNVGRRDRDTGEWQPVADCYHPADAEFIVQAVNVHDALVAACEAAYEALGSDSTGQVMAARRMLVDALGKVRKTP